mmetsp:Transcript_5075/g.8999  ORF Transcript_5075/g.8999 Transcript_5075/m.8999 type:complete len:386 (+) Transcript_5075:179-1336(+)
MPEEETYQQRNCGWVHASQRPTKSDEKVWRPILFCLFLFGGSIGFLAGWHWQFFFQNKHPPVQHSIVSMNSKLPSTRRRGAVRFQGFSFCSSHLQFVSSFLLGDSFRNIICNGMCPLNSSLTLKDVVFLQVPYTVSRSLSSFWGVQSVQEKWSQNKELRFRKTRMDAILRQKGSREETSATALVPQNESLVVETKAPLVFSIVRNPFDRMFEIFRSCVLDGSYTRIGTRPYHPGQDVASKDTDFCGLAERFFKQNEASGDNISKSFHMWLHALLRSSSWDLKKWKGLSYFDYLVDPETKVVMVDVLLSYENLEQDLKLLECSIGGGNSEMHHFHLPGALSHRSFLRRQKALPLMDASYESMFNDLTKQIIERYFHADLAFFEYHY